MRGAVASLIERKGMNRWSAHAVPTRLGFSHKDSHILNSWMRNSVSDMKSNFFLKSPATLELAVAKKI